MKKTHLKIRLLSLFTCTALISTTLSFPAHAEESEPVTLIEGKDIGITLEYYGKENTDTGPDLYYGTMENDREKATSHTYDDQTGIVEMKLANKVELIQMGSGYFTVKLGHKQSVKQTPYIAIGMYYYDPEDTDGVSVSTNIHLNDNVLWGKSIEYSPVLENHVIDASSYSGGQNGGFSAAGDQTYYDYLKISTPVTDKADAEKNYVQFIPEGTRVGVQYIAFFENKADAENYEYVRKVSEPEYSDANKIKVMSYNARTADSPKGLWVRERVQYMRELIKQKQPDIIGFQEFDSEWQQGIVGWANDVYVDENGEAIYDNTYNYRPYDFNTTNEGDGIFWNVSKFELIDSGFEYVPYPGVKFVDPIGHVQGMNWLKLKVRETGKVFYYINTHLSLDYRTRLASTSLLVDICTADEPIYDSIRISNDAPVFVTGDFNMCANSMEYAEMTSFFGDANIMLNTDPTVSFGRWWASVIDFCFYQPEAVEVLDYQVVDEVVYDTDVTDNTTDSNEFTIVKDYALPLGDDLYSISDHFGIMTELALTGEVEDYSTQAPKIRINSDKEYASEGEAVNFTAEIEACHNAVEKVSFFIDDEQYPGEILVEDATIYSDYINDYSIAVDNLTPGIHTVKAVAKDVNGNEASAQMQVEILNPVSIEFAGDNYAYANKPFEMALKIGSDDVQSVKLFVNDNEYDAVCNTDGIWSVGFENGLPTGNYKVKATVTDSNGKVNPAEVMFYVISGGNMLIEDMYAFKHQSSDGKVWGVDSANNYDLKYEGEIKDVLYSAVDLSNIAPVALKSVKLVNSTKNIGANGWTRFAINECAAFDEESIRLSDGTANTIPAIGAEIANSTYEKAMVIEDNENYAFYSENIPVTDGVEANYMELDVTDYVKSLIESGKDTMYFRAGVINNNPTDDYGFAINNSTYYLYVEYEQPKAEFISSNFAYENEGFTLAITTEAENVSSVKFLIDDEEYIASENENGVWYAYIENGLAGGEYSITAVTVNADGKETETTENFRVLASEADLVSSQYSFKHQSSDGKIWAVEEANNYDLKYEGEIKDVLYGAIDLTTVASDAIKSVRLVNSTKNMGANGWTRFAINECEAFDEKSIRLSDGTANTIPAVGAEIANSTYEKAMVSKDDENYAFYSENIPVTDGVDANYMSLDVTDYVKSLIESGKDKMYFRAGVINNNPTDDYGFTVNNSTYYLYVEYERPEFTDNFDGTFNYTVNSSKYVKDGAVYATIASYDDGGMLTAVHYSGYVTGRKTFRIENSGENCKLFIWNSPEGMKPLADAVLIK